MYGCRHCRIQRVVGIRSSNVLRIGHCGEIRRRIIAVTDVVGVSGQKRVRGRRLGEAPHVVVTEAIRAGRVRHVR